ncbi:hypothetical protein B2G71_09160 [Novosphingobium sp. PC22D]|uniref:hypothetical protein n=1 Tax=Novosphingobium sp. PC22D TaxID=1962403 RepID=UPI000BF1F6E9|nr:hypothetical protein [Novosphingobium sp. PC22D]PEQ12991.1 hypothetical protein B2G71_09160 [Novosphingobium sp. PC22D]
MQVRPEIAALRRDPDLSRTIQAGMREAVRTWRARPQVARVIAAMGELTGGAAVERLPALAELFGAEPGPSRQFAADFAAAIGAALSDQPLGHVALRHFTNGRRSTLLLARTGTVSLTLVACEAAPVADTAVSVAFPDIETWDRVLAGTARAEIVSRPRGDGSGGALSRSPRTLACGDVVVRDGRETALRLTGIDGCLVLLRLQRRCGAEPTDELRLANGAPVRRTSASAAESSALLTMTLLRAMDRQDAVPAITAIARGPGSAPLRWRAAREAIALDTRAGLDTLCEIAARADDPIAGLAAALRDDLLAAHSGLADLVSCRA